MIRHLDGLQSTSRQKFAKTTATRPRRWRKVLFWLGVLVVGTLTVAGVWAQPILAALPMNVTDKLALARLAKPGVYLVLFQNQRELRPTGGFLGSFAEVEMGWGGHIKSIQVETNIYNRDRSMPPI